MTEALFDTPFPPIVPTDVVFGYGVFEKLPGIVQTHGKRPLVVTGAHSARAMGLLDRLAGWFPEAVVFDGVPENPGTGLCDRATELARERGCDVIIAIGGGSPMDVAKAVAGLMPNPGVCRDFLGSGKFTRGCMPIVAVPTTAGSGSDTTPYAVLVDDETQTKRTISGDALFPTHAVVDPYLTLTLPRSITVATGLDALSQGMEGMVSRKAVADHADYCLEVIRLVRQYLPVVADAPDNRGARAALMRAATMSGMIVAHSGTTLVHGMGYALTLQCGIAHGLANALLLPPLFRFNGLHQPDVVARIAEALGAPDDQPPGDAVASAIHGLLAELRVSPAARGHGFHADQVAAFARGIAGDPYRFRNQTGEVDEETVRRFYTEALNGE